MQARHERDCKETLLHAHVHEICPTWHAQWRSCHWGRCHAPRACARHHLASPTIQRRGCSPFGLLPGKRPSPAPCLPILQPATENSRAGIAIILMMKRIVAIPAPTSSRLAMAAAASLRSGKRFSPLQHC